MARQLAVCAVVLSTKMLPEPLLTHVNSPLIASSLSSAIFSFRSQTGSFLFQLFGCSFTQLGNTYWMPGTVPSPLLVLFHLTLMTAYETLCVC